jgi:hypothetical protein
VNDESFRRWAASLANDGSFDVQAFVCFTNRSDSWLIKRSKRDPKKPGQHAALRRQERFEAQGDGRHEVFRVVNRFVHHAQSPSSPW